jgi:CO dehydrogenase/acetyl-CoA synthase delta subunit
MNPRKRSELRRIPAQKHYRQATFDVAVLRENTYTEDILEGYVWNSRCDSGGRSRRASSGARVALYRISPIYR